MTRWAVIFLGLVLIAADDGGTAVSVEDYVAETPPWVAEAWGRSTWRAFTMLRVSSSSP